MTSSLKRPSLSNPQKGERISQYAISFVRSRNKNKAHSFILEMFRDSKLTKKELADMLGKKPEQVTRWLAGPGNVTLDTLSDLIFALSGDFYVLECRDELSRAKSNLRSPEWLVIGACPNSHKIGKVIYSPRHTFFKHVSADSEKDHEVKYDIGRSKEERKNSGFYEVN